LWDTLDQVTPNQSWPDWSAADAADTLEMGRYGERLVYELLQRDAAANYKVVWQNDIRESGLPYDLELIPIDSLQPDNETKSESRSLVRRIEVKTTLSSKQGFLFSLAEIEEALRCSKADSHQSHEVWWVRLPATRDSLPCTYTVIKDLIAMLRKQALRLFVQAT